MNTPSLNKFLVCISDNASRDKISFRLINFISAKFNEKTKKIENEFTTQTQINIPQTVQIISNLQKGFNYKFSKKIYLAI